MRIGIIAGEASGDLLGARLIQALHAKTSGIQFEGIGGSRMIAEGFESLFDMERLAVMGLVEPLMRLPDLIKLRRAVLKHFLTNPPDLFIGIDAPAFNLGIEYQLKKAGIPIIHYVSPSVWAWGRHRIPRIAKTVDLMLTLLPFEATFYEEHHIPYEYVGHPLAYEIPEDVDTLTARRALCLDEKGTYIALLPGSRRQEINFMGKTFLEAAKLISNDRPDIKFITSHVNEKRYEEFYNQYQAVAKELPLTFFTCRSQQVMAASDAVMVTSGTATLETMLYKKPMVIVYRMPEIFYQLAKRIVKTPFIGLPNLLSGKEIVPELIQRAATPEKIRAALLPFLDEEEKRDTLKSAFQQLHQVLRAGAQDKVADIVLALLHQQKNN